MTNTVLAKCASSLEYQEVNNYNLNELNSTFPPLFRSFLDYSVTAVTFFSIFVGLSIGFCPFILTKILKVLPSYL